MRSEAKFQRLPRRTYALIVLLVLTTVGATAWIFYGRAQERVEREARENLMFIDRLKGDQLNGWWRQRQSDAAFIMRNTVNDHHIAPFLENSGRPEDREKVLAWLETIRRNSFYRSVVLADTNGQPRLSFGPADLNLTAEEKAKIVRAARSRESLFDLIHAGDTVGHLHTAFYVPVMRYDASGCIGVMMLEIDANDFLLPMIRFWPRPSRSGETLLAERDGAEVVIVNPRMEGNRPVPPVRFSLSSTNLPAVMAVNGRSGLVEGVDYRGSEVMAVLRPVPGAPWSLVTKIDREELFEPLRREAALITASSLLIFTTFCLLGLAWQRRREARFYRRQVELEEAQREQERAIIAQRHLFERIFEQTLAGYWDWYLQEKRLVMSSRMKAVLSYADYEIADTEEAWQRLVYPEDLPKVFASLERHVQSHGAIPHSAEIRYFHKDGSVVWVISAGLVVEWDGKGQPVRMVGCHTDVTERRRAVEALHESEERLHILAEAAFEGIVVTDQHVIVDCNRRLAEMLGCSREEIIGRKTTDFMLPEEAESIVKRLSAGAEGVIEAHVRRLDGSVIPVETKGGIVSRQGRALRIDAIRDVTAHKELEAELEQRVLERTQALQRSNRALQMILACNRVVLQAQKEEELLQRVCATLVEVGGYRLAWVGYKTEDAEKSVRPVAQHGFEQGYISSARLSWGDSPQGRGPTGRAIRTGSAVVCRDMMNDPDFQPWRDLAVARGYASSIALPLTIGGCVEGALMCYASYPLAFDEEEVRLLGNLADDLSFGIQSLRIRQAHDEAEKELALHKDHLEDEIRLRTEELRRSEAKLRSLFSAMTDVILIMDKDGRYLEIAPSSPHLLYRPPDEILGKTVYEIFPAEQADFFVRHVRDALSTRVPIVMEYCLPIRGRQVWFLATLSALSADSVVFVARDITATKRAELALRASEARYRALFSSSSDGIFLYQVDRALVPSKFLDVSAQGCLMTGYSRSELLRKTPLDLRHPTAAADFPRVLDELLEKKHCLYESLLAARDGRAIPVEINCTLFDLEQQPAVIATVRDITERKKFETELRLAKDAAELASRAKSEFLANMSHELRTPLNAVIGFSEILADQTFGPVNPKQAHYVDNILQAGRHLLSLINDVLDLSKVEAGKMALSPQPLLLANVIGQVLELTRGRAQKHGLSLRQDVPDGLSVAADERMLKQILFNLLSNAVKFTPAGGEIRVSAEPVEDAVRVSVADTGIGIKAEDQERVFLQFEQVDSSLSRKHQGSGLGLALCRRFVEAHGGKIWVESAGEGCGSTFRFTIPSRPANGKGCGA